VTNVSEQVLISELERLVSEERNPRTMDLDLLPTVEILRRINAEDKGVADAVEKAIPEIAASVEKIVAAFETGGRLIYMGAGTSGRIGVLDASECPPTFRVHPTMVVGLIAGGYGALLRAAEGAEDSETQGAAALEEIGLASRDVVVGIAASGRTPYVVGGLAYAKRTSATTIALSCNAPSAIGAIADIAIATIVGPEVLTGSTRMKSGTAEKLVLNMLTTASMVRIGKTYQNLMVDLKASNKKLLARATRIVMQATDCSLEEAREALTRTDSDVKLAILVTLTGMNLPDARRALEGNGGFLRRAIEIGKRRAP
jgi:N-acetylmuramic acid 6-phosphate etherase